MPVFLDRFVLPTFVAIIVAVIVTNPMRWNWHLRVSFVIAVVAVAYFVAQLVFYPTPRVSVSVQLMPPIDEGVEAEPITGIAMVFQNSTQRVQQNISARIPTPAIQNVELDNLDRIRIIDGGMRASFIHILIPEMVQDELRLVNISFAPTGSMTAAEWAKKYRYPEEIVVYRLTIGPQEKFNKTP